MTQFAIALDPIRHLTEEQFIQICKHNPAFKFERDPDGKLVVMEGTGGETGIYNTEVNTDTNLWNRQAKLGKVFHSSTVFGLPNGSLRSPDLAWIRQDRWEQLSPAQRKTFPPICPDFVLELRSPSDARSELQTKMQEYLNNGIRLGWLIDPQTQQVEIYRPHVPVEILNQPDSLSGEEVLPGFILTLQQIWFPN